MLPNVEQSDNTGSGIKYEKTVIQRCGPSGSH